MKEQHNYGLSSEIHKYRENNKLKIEENPQNQNLVLEYRYVMPPTSTIVFANVNSITSMYSYYDHH